MVRLRHLTRRWVGFLARMALQSALASLCLFSYCRHRLLRRGKVRKVPSADGCCIGMDASILVRRVSGLERYMDRIIRGLLRQDPENGGRQIACWIYTRVPYAPEAVGERYVNRVNASLPRLYYDLFADLAGNRVDLWHLPWTHLDLLLFLPMAFAPASVLTVHDLIPLRWPDYYIPPQRACFRALLGWACRRAGVVIVDSEATRGDLMRCFAISGERVHVVPLAVDERFQPAPETELRRVREKYGLPERFVFTIGRVNHYKNFGALVRAVGGLRESGAADAQLVIAGAMDYAPARREIEKIVREEQGETWVRLLNHVDDADLPALYSAAEVFGFPSLYEGFGLPVLEAMACGTPVVSSNSTSLPEVVGEAGLLVDALDVEALTAALLRVWTDAELRNGLREKGLRRAREFTWERTVELTIAAYRAALQGSRRVAEPLPDQPPGSSVEGVRK